MRIRAEPVSTCYVNVGTKLAGAVIFCRLLSQIAVYAQFSVTTIYVYVFSQFSILLLVPWSKGFEVKLFSLKSLNFRTQTGE